MLQFQKATKSGLYLKVALTGPSGAGKTYTALSVAHGLGKRIALIDTERGSASLYSDLVDFSVVNLEDFHPKHYIEAIDAAVAGGFDVLIIDSLSHAWNGKGGILEVVDKLTETSKSKNAYTAGWPTGTRLYNEMMDHILAAPIHTIVTMRSKMEYVLQDDGRGKKEPVKVGLGPIQRDGVEYEFTVVGDLSINHTMTISKTRIASLDSEIYRNPGLDFALLLTSWLESNPAPLQPSVPDQQVTAPAASIAPIPASPHDSEWQALYAKCVAKVRRMQESGLNGYDHVANIQDDVRVICRVPKLIEADLSGLQRFYEHLGAVQAKTDTPFEHHDPAAPLPEPAATGPVMSADQAKLQKIVDDVRREIEQREIVPDLAEFMLKSAQKFAEAGDTTSLKAQYKQVQGFPLRRDPRLDDMDIQALHGKISAVLKVMVDKDIDGFGSSKRMTNSLNDHLHTKKLKECFDVDLLVSYLKHLNEKLEAAS